MWAKCDKCGEIIYKKDLEDNLMVCPKCKAHFRLSAMERIKLIIDEGTFEEFDKNLRSSNPLNFPDYEKKVQQSQEDTGITEAVITGKGKINENETVIAVMDSHFMMGSMGSVVGEKITRAIETGYKAKTSSYNIYYFRWS